VVQEVGFPRNRGVAVYEGKIFIGMNNGHLAALDAKTGKEIWNRETVEDPKTGYYSMVPVSYKGKILIGESNGDLAASAILAHSIQIRATVSGSGSLFRNRASQAPTRGAGIPGSAAAALYGTEWRSIPTATRFT
jgi:outer membrane protein assembly factor BamB